MRKSLPILDDTGEIRNLTGDDLRQFRPASEVLPKELFDGLVSLKKPRRGPQKTPTKERVTIRLSPEVLAKFRSTGRGWQTRIDEALLDWIEQQA